MNKLISCALLSIVVCCCSFKSSIIKENQLIQQKWTIINRATISHNTAGTDSAAVKGAKSDYIEFRKDGKAYSNFKGSHDTLEYAIINDNTISFGDELFQIASLSSNEMVLYQNEEDSNGDYNRVWIRLKK